MSERRTEEESAAGPDVEAPVVDARFDFGRVWRVAAYALLAAAVALIFLRRFEAAFLVAGLGAAAWFLNVRATLIRKHDLVKVGGRDWRPRREVKEDVEEDDEE